MTFDLEKYTLTSLNNQMPNFLKLQTSITAHPRLKDILILHHALHAVKYKIEAANLYILILNKTYVPSSMGIGTLNVIFSPDA